MQIHVNGTDLFYVKRGSGRPFLLLHGNGQDHTIYQLLIRQLAKHYTVYAIDSRGHGKNKKIKSLSYMDIMEDTAQFIKDLTLINPILYGFSDGGIVGLLLAIHYPHILQELIISGANTNPDGLNTFFHTFIKMGYFFSKNYKLKMMLDEPHITNDELSTIQIPTMILAGSHDIIKREHTENIAYNIPDAVLKIVQGESHGSYIVSSTKLYKIMQPFLDAY